MMKKRMTFFLLIISFLILNNTTFSNSPDTVSSDASGARFGSFITPAGTTTTLARVTATDRGTNNMKFTNPYNPPQVFTTWAGTFKGDVDGNAANFYCVDILHYLAFWKNNDPNYYKDSIFTPSTITYVLMNYFPYKSYPYPGALNSREKEAAAIQIALWHFADGVDLSTVTNSNANLGTEIRNRAIQIVNDANANAGSLIPVKTLFFTDDDMSLLGSTPASFTLKAFNELAQPAANVTVTLTATGGVLSQSTVQTTATGETPVITFTPNPGATNVTINASAQVIVPQGTRYFHTVAPNTYQKLVLATPAVGFRTASLNLEWTQLADLSLSKSVSDPEPDNGDVITYTLTLTNNGPVTATNVEISDLFPDGLEFISASNSGAYNNGKITWNILSVPSGGSVQLTITARVNIQVQPAFDLGVAKDYNLFVLRDLNQPSSDTEGKVAVGRDCYLSNYSVGYTLPASGGTEDVLVVGRNVVFVSGDIFGGNAVYGNTETISQQVGIVDGTKRQDNIIDFEAAKNYLQSLSAQLNGYTTNGSTTVTNGVITVTLDGSDPFLNVFALTAQQLTDAQEVFINVPNGSVVLVNVRGNNIDWGGNLVVNGTSYTNALFNFYNATDITISQIDVTGTILAPKADINFITGVQHGQMICKSLTGQAQFNNRPFIGNLPIDETITNVAEVTASDQLDPDSSPNNGVDTEDDFATAAIHVFDLASGGSGGGSTGLGNWAAVGNPLPNEEFGWCLTYDNSGNILVGTWGGKIYRSTDGGLTFSHLNPGMGAAFIWSIAVGSGNTLYASTERGVYKSTDNGTTWVSSGLASSDVRGLAINPSDGAIYAATWGTGAYKSTDNGANWTQINNGLENLAASSILIHNNTILIGTFGGSIGKSVDGGASWAMINAGTPYIWSLGKSSNGTIFAGAYGSGLFVSNDAGASWFRESSGLNASYIYGITGDQSGNVFLSSWNNGIWFASPSTFDNNASYNWQSIGMQGTRVTAIVYNQADGSLLAATSNGQFFKNDAPTSNRESGITAPGEFALMNNYPNPFNPSTVIEFSVKTREFVTLSVYNISGELVSTLLSNELNPGKYSISFDARGLASGIYIYRLSSPSGNIVRKMILQK
ncbi:MAG: choice-of-anchor A family protein [Ignavibacteriaceae bacterium]|nr:choice-of-anchor A family protein [Ignavibacteriaceae bacterium]